MNTLALLESIANELEGAEAPQPSGQLSGHAGGLVFEEMAHQKLIEAAPGRAFRHYEALNKAFGMAYERHCAPKDQKLGEPALHYLVSRGKDAIKKWSPKLPFVEKQNDTAESILFSDGMKLFDSENVALIDIKSQNICKNSQPPNIISARKLLEAGKKVLHDKTEPKFDIFYLGVKFQPLEKDDGTKILRAEDWRAVDLFKINPEKLYINWSAALQVQFHPFEVDQDFDGSRRDWFETFLSKKYAPSLKIRINKLQKQLDEILRLINR